VINFRHRSQLKNSPGTKGRIKSDRESGPKRFKKPPYPNGARKGDPKKKQDREVRIETRLGCEKKKEGTLFELGERGKEVKG